MFIRNATETDRAAYLSMAHTFFHSDAVCHPIPDSHLVRTFDAALSGNPLDVYKRQNLYRPEMDLAYPL